MSIHSESWFNLGQGEEVLWYSHPSFVMWIPALAGGLIFALLGLLTAVYVLLFLDLPMVVVYGALAAVPIGLVITAWKYLVFKNTWYVITNKRIIKKTDIIGRSTSSKTHDDIVRVDVSVRSIDAIVSKFVSEDIGSIVVRTADDTGQRFTMEQIPSVSNAETMLERLTGVGPDTPAAMDAEERDEWEKRLSGGSSTTELADDAGGSSHESLTNPSTSQQLDRSDERVTSPDQTDKGEDTMDQFEPSDRA